MKGVIKPEWSVPANVVAGTMTRLCKEDVLPTNVKFLNQVHGAAVVVAADLRRSQQPLAADAVVGRESGDWCVIRTADCLPVLFCAQDGTEVAAAHAGWRGLAAGVLENTVRAMRTSPSELLVWIGPAISQANFEVGDEVREAFLAGDERVAGWFRPNARGRWQADLFGLARQRLQRCGVSAISGGKWCTYGDSKRFHSYRRERDTGRILSFVALK